MKKLLLLLLALVTVLTLSACQKDVTFELLQADTANQFTTGMAYTEYGFIARDGNTDISEYVTVSGDVVPTEAGDYSVHYVLDYNGKQTELVRTVYYREDGCEVVEDTTITKCTVYWTQYLHTTVKLTTYYDGDSYNDTMHYVFDNVEGLLSDYHQLSTKYDDYPGVENVYAINETPNIIHTLDPRLYDMITFALNHQGDVDNLFNIALGPVLKLWHDAREACNRAVDPVCEIPSMLALQAVDQYTDPSGIIMNSTNHTLTMEEHMSIDLGGVSKGYISGKVIEYLDTLPLHGYILNNGTSNISVGGSHPTRETGEFSIAITDPSSPDTGAYYAIVMLGAGEQLVTSGDYQQFFVVDGQIYHHIINPNTLMPERNSRSVTLAYSDPAIADLYSTAIFTMTIEDGLNFVNSIPGMEAIWYTLDGKAVMSDNFEALYLSNLYIEVDTSYN